MFRKLYLLFLCVILSMFFCSCTLKKDENVQVDLLNKVVDRGHLIIGVKTDSYPFGYKTNSNAYAGYDIEVAKLIAKGILGDSSKVKFVEVSSSDRIMKLYSGDIDAIIATMSVTQKRREILDFSDSYYLAGQSILVKRGSGIKNIKDLKNKTVIIVFGSTSEQSIRNTIPNVKILGYRTYNDAFKALKSGKGHAIVSDNSILLGFALKDKNVILLPKLYTKEPYAVAFRKESESASMIKTVNEILEAETRNGHLKNLQKTFRID